MDNHPIPQDVTGFQFKLIGNMTIKQFAYLATGIILAWVFFQLPISFLIKIPLCAFLAILGIGLAYLPVSGRPMDLMIGHFIKALFRPTQFVYEKSGTPLFPKAAFTTKIYKNNFSPIPKDKLKAYLASYVTEKSVPSLLTNNSTSKTTLDPNLNTAPVTFTKNVPKPLNDIHPTKPTPQPVNQKAVVPPLIVKHVPILSVPDSPNLITGVTKDPRGNPLSNILVEVKDKEGNPVRAFKTNEVGRFASATPLLNGTYTIEFEDPKRQNKFDPRLINVTGQIIMPLVVASIDTREELRKSLFSGNS